MPTAHERRLADGRGLQWPAAFNATGGTYRIRIRVSPCFLFPDSHLYEGNPAIGAVLSGGSITAQATYRVPCLTTAHTDLPASHLRPAVMLRNVTSTDTSRHNCRMLPIAGQSTHASSSPSRPRQQKKAWKGVAERT
jgi:hypothetical protein